MINLIFSVRNPYSERFNNIKYWSGQTAIKHKFWELQIMQTSDIVSLTFDLTHRQDHAGVRIGVGVAGYNIDFSIYDNRHWDSAQGRYGSYSEGESLH